MRGDPDRGERSAAELLLRAFDSSGAPPGEVLLPEQWEEVERAAARHGLVPLLYRQLTARAGPSAPPDVMQRLRDVHVHSALRSMAVRAALDEALTALRRAGISVMVLKGAYLAEAVYDEPSLRPMADVDLLVRRGELQRTRAVLESLGYVAGPEAQAQEHHHLPAFVRRGAIPIEVHWTPVRPGLAMEAGDASWTSARPARVAGVEVLALQPEALLHHLCVHVAHGHRFWVPLLHLHDLAAVARRYPSLDWDRLRALARAHGTERFVYAALALAGRAFASRFPPAALECVARLAHDAEDDAVVALVWESLVAPPREFPRLLARVEAAPDGVARARLLWRHLFPSPTRMRLVAHTGPRPLAWAYVLRVARLARHGWRTPLVLLSGTAEARAARALASRRALVERWVHRDETA